MGLRNITLILNISHQWIDVANSDSVAFYLKCDGRDIRLNTTA